VLALLVQIVCHWPTLVYLPLSPHARGFLREACLVWLSRVFRRRVVGHVHSGAFADRFYASRSFLGRWWVRRTCGRLDRVLIPCAALAPNLARIAPCDRIRCVPGGAVDVGLGEVCRTPQRERCRARVVSVGPLTRGRGLFVVLETARRVRRVHDGVEFFLYGSWPNASEQRSAERFVVDHGLIDTVHFPGPVTSQTRPYAYALADVFLFVPNEPAGMPVAVLEAMSAGRAIVATSQAALPEMLRHGRDALLVPPGDCAAIERAILLLAEHPQWRLQMGRRVRHLYVKHYTSRHCVDRLLQVLDPAA